MPNFVASLTAITNDIHVVILNIIFEKLFWAFAAGVLLSTLTTAFILTKNPRHIPLILRYSKAESFQRIGQRDTKGTYITSFNKFARLRTEIHLLFYLMIAMFAVMVTTLLVIIFTTILV